MLCTEVRKMLNKEIKIIGCKKCVALTAVVALLSVVGIALFVGGVSAGAGFAVKLIVAGVLAALLAFGWAAVRFGYIGAAACGISAAFNMLANGLFGMAVALVLGANDLTVGFVAMFVNLACCCTVFGAVKDSVKQNKALTNVEAATAGVNKVKSVVLAGYVCMLVLVVVFGAVGTVMGLSGSLALAIAGLLSAVFGLFTSLDVAANLWVVLKK